MGEYSWIHWRIFSRAAKKLLELAVAPFAVVEIGDEAKGGGPRRRWCRHASLFYERARTLRRPNAAHQRRVARRAMGSALFRVGSCHHKLQPETACTLRPNLRARRCASLSIVHSAALLRRTVSARAAPASATHRRCHARELPCQVTCILARRTEIRRLQIRTNVPRRPWWSEQPCLPPSTRRRGL